MIKILPFFFYIYFIGFILSYNYDNNNNNFSQFNLNNFIKICNSNCDNNNVLALKRCNESITFTIHGLWSENMEYCNGTDFDMNELSMIDTELNKMWYSCYTNSSNYNNADFWKHEWDKHGKCFNYTEYDYFNNVIELYKNIDYTSKCDFSKLNCLIQI